MKRFLQTLSKRDWMLVIGGLAVVLGLQMAKRSEPPLPRDTLAGIAAPIPTPIPTPISTPEPAGLPPSPEGLANDAYHLRPAPDVAEPSPASEVLQPDPGHAVVFFGAASRIEVHRVLASDERREAFDRVMRGAPYFGAFAAADNGGHGWTMGYGTQAAARAAALAHCARHAQDCEIIADVLPAGLTGDPPANSVSHEQAQAYNSVRAGSGPRVLALSVDGTWAYSSAASHPEAISTVLRNCEAARAAQQDFLPKMPCRVFATWD